MKERKTVIVIVVAVFALAALLFIFFPPGSGDLPQFRGADGEVLPGSISEKCRIDIDGKKIALIIQARDRTKPVLLICGGGPGISEYLLEYLYPTSLSDDFVVCYVEYRGTGLSYDPNDNAADMTTERYLADIANISVYLRERFEQEKLYILGHSFGSRLAYRAVREHPEYYAAYIAMSQSGDQRQSEYLAYDFMKEQYTLLGNKKMVKKFGDCPIKESEEAYQKYSASSLRDTAMHDLGVGTTRDMRSVITGLVFPSLRCRNLTWGERINLWRGKVFSFKFPILNDSLNASVLDAQPSVQIPVYFLAGQYDYTCCYSLQKEFYEQLDAPEKEFYTFENSAHSPLFEQPEKARQILRDICMKQP